MSITALSDEERRFFSELFTRHAGILYKTALDLGLTKKDERDDAVHEALLRLPKHLATLRAMSERARAAYLASVLRSVVLDRRDRERLERRHAAELEPEALEALPDDEDLEEAFLEREMKSVRARQLWEALAALSDDDRALLIAKYVDRRSDYELAAALGLSPESIPKKLTRAKRRAKAILLAKEANGHD